MVDPLFWLGLSILLVAVSLTAVLVVALPALQELSRAARSAEKLFDTLNRELPPTLEAIRLTGLEISELTDDMSEGVQSAEKLVKQVEQGLSSTRQKAHKVQTTTRSVLAGAKAAWKVFTRKPALKRRQRERHLPAGGHSSLELERKSPSYAMKPSLKGWEDRAQHGFGELPAHLQEPKIAYSENEQPSDSWEELTPVEGLASDPPSEATEVDDSGRSSRDRIIAPLE
ncbi:MAG: hypothetical protein QNJ46_03940 [Leptolyngbyaceae cyanobacterium MO_188.B28]|nr:hypothetical protein [Leptolyngbyaceae cyanobacterium MO_188.B28]